MTKFILSAIAIAVLGFVAAVMMRPDDWVVTRTATFNAAPEKVFVQINNLQNWNAWSPWAKLDPNAVVKFEGPAAGVGASMAWDSKNDQVGIGKMTVTESAPNEKIVMNLEFKTPMESTSTAEFGFKNEGQQTTVSWTMRAKPNFISKAMGLIFNCDKIVGDMFESGFANIKGVVEK